MKQKLIRDIPDDVMAAIEQKALAADTNSEEWIQRLLIRVSTEPVQRECYAYRFYGPGETRGTVSRLSNLDGMAVNCKHCTEVQLRAVERAVDLMRRNEPGDQLKAYDLLKANFEEVFEVPV
jgi:hypothetical protein